MRDGVNVLKVASDIQSLPNSGYFVDLANWQIKLGIAIGNAFQRKTRDFSFCESCTGCRELWILFCKICDLELKVCKAEIVILQTF